jgi:hypothetical protein
MPEQYEWRTNVAAFSVIASDQCTCIDSNNLNSDSNVQNCDLCDTASQNTPKCALSDLKPVTSTLPDADMVYYMMGMNNEVAPW